MLVIKATDYGTRTVVRVALNPDDPEWVHAVGAPLRDSSGTVILEPDGSERLVVSPDVPVGETGATCHNCRYNWVVRELIFDGPEFKDLSADTLWELVCERCEPASLPVPIIALLGRSD